MDNVHNPLSLSGIIGCLGQLKGFVAESLGLACCPPTFRRGASMAWVCQKSSEVIHNRNDFRRRAQLLVQLGKKHGALHLRGLLGAGRRGGRRIFDQRSCYYFATPLY